MDNNDTNVSDVQSENIHAIPVPSTKARRLLEYVRKRKLMPIIRWSVVVLIIIGIIILTTIMIKKKTDITEPPPPPLPTTTTTTTTTTTATATTATTPTTTAATTTTTTTATTATTPTTTAATATTTTTTTATTATTPTTTAATATTTTTTKTATTATTPTTRTALSTTTTTPTTTAATATTTKTTATTATITTTTAQIALISIDGSIKAIHNTVVRGDSLASTPGLNVGNYPSDHPAARACDRNISTKYLNFGQCNEGNTAAMCGSNTGFYLELQQGALLVTGLRMCTGNDFPDRDPLQVSLEGSNESGAALTLGTSWTLIYKGNSGLEPDPNRDACGLVQPFNNSIQYKSYRFLVSAKRGLSNSVQYSELQLFN